MADFNQAIEWLKEGKKVKRKCWGDNSYIVENLSSISASFKFENGEDLWLSREMFESTDWEIFEEDKPKVIILDDNALSIMHYAEEFPENWKKICEALDKKKEIKK